MDANPSADYIIGWLRGFFDGEGSVRLAFYSYPKRNIKNQPSREVYVVNTDFALIQKCQDYLGMLGIPFRLNIHRNRSYPGCKRCYKIRIGTNDGIIKFADRVGFSTGWKADKMKELSAWCARPGQHAWRGTRDTIGRFVHTSREEK
jgi:intein/homing endonuclease